MNKEYNLNIDIKKTPYVVLRGIKQDENNVILNIKLTHDSVPLNLSECIVRINYKRPDSKVLLQTADIIDGKQGKIKVNLLTKALKLSGNLISDISIFDKNNKKITSTSFTIVVSPSVYTNDSIDEDDLDIIQSIEKNELDRQEGYKEMKETIDNIEQVEEYDNNKEYNKLNRVTFNGSCYECIKDSKGNNPTNTEYWICIAERGKDGEGSGDMHTDIYDKNGDGVVDIAENALSIEWKNIKNIPEMSDIKSVNGKTGEVVLEGKDIALSDDTTVEQQLMENLVKKHTVDGVESIEQDGMATVEIEGNTIRNTELVQLDSVGKIDLISCGKNLFNKRAKGYNGSGRSVCIVNESGITIKSNPSGEVGYYVIPYKLKPNTQYTIQSDMEVINGSSRIAIRNHKGGSIDLFDSTGSKTFTTDDTGEGFFYFYSLAGMTGSEEYKVIYTNIQLEEGTQATDYEQYKGDKVSIKLHEPIRKLSNEVMDEIKDNTLIRRIGKVILDGSEEWEDRGLLSNGLRRFTASVVPYKVGDILCDRLEEQENLQEWTELTERGIGIFKENNDMFYLTLEDGETPKEILEGGVTVLYTTVESTIEQIYIKPIKCYKGGNLIANTNIETQVTVVNSYTINGRVGTLESLIQNQGDMLKSTYDKNNDGIVDLSERALSVEWGAVLNKPDISELLTVESVNDKTGKVVLTSEDIIYKNNETLEQYKNKNEQIVSTLGETIENMGKIEVYDSSKEYKRLNRVTYDGSTYEALKDVPMDIPPTNTEYWICIAEGATNSGNSGDMLKSTYDKNDNGIVDRAEEAMSVEWTNIKNAPDLSDVSKVKSVNGQTGVVILRGKDIEYDDGYTLENFKTTIENHFSADMPHVGMTLKGYSEHVKSIDDASGNTTIDLKEGNIYNIKPVGNCIFTLVKPTKPNAYSVTVFIHQPANAHAISFPPSVKWQNGDVPDLTKGDTIYILTFINISGTPNWFGIFGGGF